MKNTCKLKGANCLLSRERKGEMNSLSHMSINIIFFTIFSFPHLIFNFPMFRRNHKLPLKLNLLQSYLLIMNNGVFMKPIENVTTCIFLYAPYTNQKEYIQWLNKVELKKAKVWKKQGLFNLIQLSRVYPIFEPSLKVDILLWR